jgi:hypothetical protein
MHCCPLFVSAAVVLILVAWQNPPPSTDWSYSKDFICSVLSLWGRMHIYYLLLLVWFPFADPEPSSCDLCMCTTQAGRVVTITLLFHTYYCCAGSVIGSCTHNHTTYLMCSHGNQRICFNPTYCPRSNG